MKENINPGVINFGDYTYRINLDKLKEICLTSSNMGGAKEMQIAQTYEMNDDDELTLLSRVEHETRSSNNPQNDMIVYDIVKILLTVLLEDNSTLDNITPTFNRAITINTLLSWGVLEKI
jgi:hypothetical protein